jgi:glyoxylase-like metal-dependent hydrolase (beta-lactamase superfamily II)
MQINGLFLLLRSGKDQHMKTWITRSGCHITRVLFGRSNVFLLSAGKTRILIDSGWSGDGKKLMKRLVETGAPDSVIMTHTHFDHAGNAGKLKEKFSPVFIVQEHETAFLESGDSPIPKGTRWWTRFIYNLGAERVPQWFHVQGVTADISFGDLYDLSGYGLNGYIMHTPGHSAGSSCIIVDDEIALVGDTMVGTPGSIFSPWGDNPAAIVISWEKLLSTGCHTFLPSHGFPVDRERLERERENF